jgi:hypothetical protein
MGIKFANSAFATLASGINNSATSITLTTGQGARFPSLSAGDFFYATLIDTSNNLEIIKCTARSTDVLTVTRAEESTTARAFSAGDRIELRVTAAGFSEMVQAGNTNTFTAAQTFRVASAIRSEAAAAQDAVVIAGRAGGSSSYAVTITPAALTASRTATLPDPGANYTIGFRNVPLSGSAKTGSYTLTVDDVGEYIEVASGGSITIPNSTFAAGDVISIINNHTAAITITCSITDAYIAGTDTDKATMSLATRGIATVLFLSGTRCIVTGNVT